MKEITRCVVGFRKPYNFEVRWLLSQVVTKQINDLLFSWFRIGKHRVPEAVIVVGAVAELTSTEQRAAASLLLGSTSTSTQRATSNEQRATASLLLGSRAKYEQAARLLQAPVCCQECWQEAQLSICLCTMHTVLLHNAHSALL